MIHVWELHFNIRVLPFKARRLLSWRPPPPAGRQPNSSSGPSGRWNSASLMFLCGRQRQQQQAAALSITSITHNAPAAELNHVAPASLQGGDIHPKHQVSRTNSRLVTQKFGTK